MAYELNGTTFEADEEGYLVDISAWNKELADTDRRRRKHRNE